MAAVLSNISNFLLDLLFMFVFGWGVAGAALATSLSQYMSAAIMLALLIQKGWLQPRHLLHRPSWALWAPLLKVRIAYAHPSVDGLPPTFAAHSKIGHPFMFDPLPTAGIPFTIAGQPLECSMDMDGYGCKCTMSPTPSHVLR